jgi:hypothetical protein
VRYCFVVVWHHVETSNCRTFLNIFLFLSERPVLMIIAQVKCKCYKGLITWDLKVIKECSTDLLKHKLFS